MAHFLWSAVIGISVWGTGDGRTLMLGGGDQ